MRVAKYSAMELPRGGREIEIRAVRPSDQNAFLDVIDRTSRRSLYRGFFGARRSFSVQIS